MSQPKSRVAVVLFNLGGPDGPKAVRPFLENLFSDPAILALPWLPRRALAKFIAMIRERSAIANYARMGGGSPILPQTQAQAAALETALQTRLPEAETKAFIAMRYWRPTILEAAREVLAYRPDHVVLAPLYPQYSTTTTGSSFRAWRKAYKGAGRSHAMCCWFENPGLIDAHAERIQRTWDDAGRPAVRLLFSAHGLPERIVQRGDPYQWQVEATCRAVANRLGATWDWRICYQSRVGPMKWLGPSTPEAVMAAGRDGVGVLIDPIAFVSEHIETLVELDIDYAEVAAKAGVPCYLRAPTVGVEARFIEGLADGVRRALRDDGVCPDGVRCPAELRGCGRTCQRGPAG